MKKCTKCHLEQLESAFYADNRFLDGLRSQCKKCVAIASRETNLKRRHGLTPADITAMIAAQDGRCSICGTTDPGRGEKRLLVDHDHKTKKVRGLLCHNCNALLGDAKDNISTIQAAIEYLNKWNGDNH